MEEFGDVAARLSAVESGRVSAVAGQAQRDLQRCAASYGDLFAAKPFDPALYSTIALANAFCAPWLGAHELRIANRASLWAFGLDWQVDYLAKSAEEVRQVIRRCVSVADGTPPAEEDMLARFLADILAELAAAPAFPELEPVWRRELDRMLAAMAREWEWQAMRSSGDESRLPTFDEYLENADNICFSFVFVSHWILTSGSPPIAHATDIVAAGRLVQQVIRLLNDLGTYDRDITWGDLNPLMLGVSRDDVLARIAELVAASRPVLRDLHEPHPRLAAFLDRYIGFNTGFYGLTDYWGEL